VDNQKNMLIHVLQGERERAKDNWSLGKFAIDFEPAPKGVPRIGVQFEIDANGILHVLARDTKTGKQTVVEMKSAVDVEDADVQRMVEESVEHAFEDLAARRWIEASLKAKETVSATSRGLAECGTELSGGQREQIEAAMLALEALVREGEAKGSAGDVEKLRNANAALDVATQPLAELMMDRAMEGWLKKKGLIG
jgi:molecular chaperone DnaK